MVESAVLTALRENGVVQAKRDNRYRRRSSFHPLPYNDDGEIQQVPRVAQIGSAVSDETVGDDLHDTLDREDD